MATRLSVNINKIATLRNARGGSKPDVVQAAIKCEEYGAQGITVHPRPDQRHIRYSDVRDLKKVVSTEFNIEGYPNKEFTELILEVMPDQVTLVPDPPGVLTSNAGWDTKMHLNFLKEVIAQYQSVGIRTSIFIDTNLDAISYAKETGADRIELYTEPYAIGYIGEPEKAVIQFSKAAEHANSIGLGVNAGHDLDLHNLEFFISKVRPLNEVSIGHALISDALYYGLENTIRMYLRKITTGDAQL